MFEYVKTYGQKGRYSQSLHRFMNLGHHWKEGCKQIAHFYMAHAPGSRCRKFLSLNLQNFRFIVSCHLRKIEKMIYDVNFFKALYKLCLMKRVAKSSSRLDNSLLKMPLATNY